MSKLSGWIAKARGKASPDPVERPEAGQPHDDINEAFHAAYDAKRVEAHEEVPVAVVLGDRLTLLHRGERSEYCIAPRSFHVIKSIVHAPVGIFAMLLDGRGDDQQREKLASLRERLEQARQSLANDPELETRARSDLQQVVEQCLAFIAAPGDVDAFAAALGPTLLRLTDDATKLQLDRLHAQTEAALARLNAKELGDLQVVVAGDHQARERSLPMQYFRKRMNEPDDREHHVTFAEAVADEESAVTLVGTRRLDHAIGRAFFGDQNRLQRDILGDAAHRQIAERF